MPMIIDGTNGLTFPDTSRQYNGYFGFKNRIINGDMRIDQRNAGASVTQTTANTYTLDRWVCAGSVTSKFTVQQNAGSLSAANRPAGFSNYLGITSSAATTVSAGDYYYLMQGIEGFNVADLGWGTANAQTVTFSFWVRSSLTGTFGGAIRNLIPGATRSYPFTYTINAANTFEQKTITIAGDTSGTWATDNSNSVTVCFSMGSGATFNGTAGAWAAGNLISATGATSVVGTNGATFYITGVQLEKGSTATSFDVRPYTTELQLCQRYANNYTSTTANGAYYRYVDGQCINTTQFEGRFVLPVPMRITPSLTTSGSGSAYAIYHASSITNLNAVPVIETTGANTQSVSLTATVASGLTAGRAATLISSNNQTTYLLFTAEL